MPTQNLYPDILVNTENFFVPAFVERYTINVSQFANQQTTEGGSLSGTQYPSLFTNQSVVRFPKIGNSTIVPVPDGILSTVQIFSPTVKIKQKLDSTPASSQVFNPGTASPVQVNVSHFDNSSSIRKPLARLLDFIAPVDSPNVIPRPSGILPVGERNTYGIEKTFKDFSLMFRPHPLTGDITRVFDYDSVTQSIKLIIYTEFFERPFSSQGIAGGIRSRLFEINDQISRREIQERISQTILRHEPRVIIQSVNVKSTDNPNSVNVTITYKIRTFERSETFSMFLERV